MQTTLIQPTEEQKVQLLRERFRLYGWKSKPVHRCAHVYMVYKPNAPECVFFIVFWADGTIKLLPPREASESYQEAKKIIEEFLIEVL